MSPAAGVAARLTIGRARPDTIFSCAWNCVAVSASAAASAGSTRIRLPASKLSVPLPPVQSRKVGITIGLPLAPAGACPSSASLQASGAAAAGRLAPDAASAAPWPPSATRPPASSIDSQDVIERGIRIGPSLSLRFMEATATLRGGFVRAHYFAMRSNSGAFTTSGNRFPSASREACFDGETGWVRQPRPANPGPRMARTSSIPA